MQVKIQKIHPQAKVPFYAHKGDAGLDLYSVDDVEITPGDIKLVHTGIIMELPEGTEAQVRPRSGLALKHGISLVNSPGTIDEGYRGEVGVIVINHGKETFHVEVGTKIAQMVIKPVLRCDVVEAESLSETSRGEGGFGSSGKY